MARLSLTARAFLFSSACVCGVALCLLLVVNALVHSQVKREFREQLRRSDALLNHAQADYSRRLGSLTSKLADAADFKAAIGLMGEVGLDPVGIKQARNTIVAELVDLQAASGFDLLAVVDLNGKVMANAPCASCSGAQLETRFPVGPGLTELNGKLYQTQAVHVSGDEDLAILILGVPFQMRDVVVAGEGALTYKGRIVESTLPAGLRRTVESELKRNCSAVNSECEGTLDGQTFLFSEVQKGQLGPGYRLFCAQSVDKLAKEFSSHFLKSLLSVAAAGVVLALVFTFMTARFVSRPLRAFVAQLESSDNSGGMVHLQPGTSVTELASLADAYNHVVDCEERIRGQLEVARDAAQVANRLKDEFLTNVSHELRTPLNGILGMTELMLASPLDGEQVEYAQLTQSSAAALLGLVESLLDFSQLQTGDLMLHSSAFDILPIMQATATSIRSEAESKGLRVEVQDLRKCTASLLGDKARIRQVLAILCENAVKFTDRGYIRLRVHCQEQGTGAQLRIEVEDSGIGISAASQKLAFERFTQADGSLTRKRGGTGLGLALAKHLVSVMGGEIGVNSVPDQGSTFWFALHMPVSSLGGPVEEDTLAFKGAEAC